MASLARNLASQLASNVQQGIQLATQLTGAVPIWSSLGCDVMLLSGYSQNLTNFNNFPVRSLFGCKMIWPGRSWDIRRPQSPCLVIIHGPYGDVPFRSPICCHVTLSLGLCKNVPVRTMIGFHITFAQEIQRPRWDEKKDIHRMSPENPLECPLLLLRTLPYPKM